MEGTTLTKPTIEHVKLQCKFGAPEPTNEDMHNMDGWTCTLRYRGRQYTFPFYMGKALCREPTISDVLYSLVSDSEASEMSFSEWCGELGYNDDSRKAERTYQACVRVGARLKKLFGADYDAIVEYVRENF